MYLGSSFHESLLSYACRALLRTYHHGETGNEQKGFVAFVRAEDDEFFLVGATVDEEDYLSVIRLLGLWERA